MSASTDPGKDVSALARAKAARFMEARRGAGVAPDPSHAFRRVDALMCMARDGGTPRAPVDVVEATLDRLGADRARGAVKSDPKNHHIQIDNGSVH
jgi:hypothetical protein